MSRAFFSALFFSLMVSASATGCAHREPVWLSGHQHEGRGVYGVGKAEGISDRTLARHTAANRARVAVLEQLQADHTTPLVRAATLRGVEIREYWETNGVVYALAVYRDPS